jgi:hypothetical protein
MKGKISPIFHLFDTQFKEAKNTFLTLGKQYKGKKAVELEQKLIFLEIYVDLISKIHFEEEKLKFEILKPFKELFRGLKKTKHLKLVLEELNKIKLKNKLTYNSYEKFLLDEKKDHYNKIYDLILSTPLGTWEKFFESVYQHSAGLNALMVNTATTQIINEELDFFNLDNKSKLDNKALKDIYEGLRVIIALENIRIESGLNAIFVSEVHDKMKLLQLSLLSWYQNQLFTQHLVYFFGKKNDISKKYKDLLTEVKIDKKKYTLSVENQCKYLFDRILE